MLYTGTSERVTRSFEEHISNITSEYSELHYKSPFPVFLVLPSYVVELRYLSKINEVFRPSVGLPLHYL